MKNLSNVFLILAVFLACAMCFVVGYDYADMLWGVRYGGYSAPAWTAFLIVIPYALAIAVCLILSRAFRKRV